MSKFIIFFSFDFLGSEEAGNTESWDIWQPSLWQPPLLLAGLHLLGHGPRCPRMGHRNPTVREAPRLLPTAPSHSFLPVAVAHTSTLGGIHSLSAASQGRVSKVCLFWSNNTSVSRGYFTLLRKDKSAGCKKQKLEPLRPCRVSGRRRSSGSSQHGDEGEGTQGQLGALKEDEDIRGV